MLAATRSYLARAHLYITETAESGRGCMVHEHPQEASALASNKTQPSRLKRSGVARNRADSEDLAAVRQHRELARHGRQARVLFLERVANFCVETVGFSSRISL